MKKIIVAAIVLLLLGATVTVDTYAKAAYCGSALERCTERCRSIYGDWNPMTAGCMAGCSIGYVLC